MKIKEAFENLECNRIETREQYYQALSEALGISNVRLLYTYLLRYNAKVLKVEEEDGTYKVHLKTIYERYTHPGHMIRDASERIITLRPQVIS